MSQGCPYESNEIYQFRSSSRLGENYNGAVFNVESSVELIKAQQLELDRWKQYNVFNEVSDNGQEVISTRWVFTQKSQDGETKVKARLVARGFEEDTTDIRTDSPTISKENFRLICSIGA